MTKDLQKELEIKQAELKELEKFNEDIYAQAEVKYDNLAEKIKSLTGTSYKVRVLSDAIKFNDDNRDVFSIYADTQWSRTEDLPRKIELGYYSTPTGVEDVSELNRLIELGKIATLLKDNSFIELIRNGLDEVSNFKKENRKSTGEVDNNIRAIKEKIKEIEMSNLLVDGAMFEVKPELSSRSKYEILYKESIWPNTLEYQITRKTTSVKIEGFTPKKVKVNLYCGEQFLETILVPKDEMEEFVTTKTVVKVN